MTTDQPGQLDMTKNNLTLQKMWDAYGFDEDPYSSSADPRFLYFSDGHKKAFQGMVETVIQRLGLTAVIGGYGYGKSTLARKLAERFRTDPKVILLYLDGINYSTEYGVLLAVCDAFRIPHGKGLSGQWKEFMNWVISKAENDINVVIIFDEAQMFTKAGLDFVHKSYNFDVTRKLVQTFLVGQTDLTRRLENKPELRDRVMSWISILPLNIEETVSLINYRSLVAGRKEPLYTSRAMNAIYNASGGSPRQIVIICRECLNVIFNSGKQMVDESEVQLVINIINSNRLKLL